MLRFSFSSSSARVLHHCTWLLEVGRQPYSGPCCESSSGSSVLILALVESRQFSAQPCSSPETLRHHIDEKFPWCPHSTWDISLFLNSRCKFGFHCNNTLLVQLSVSVWFQRLQHNLAGEKGIERPNSLFHDLAGRFDRNAAKPTAIIVRDLDIACVHDLLRLNELSFQVAYKKNVIMHVLSVSFPNSFCAYFESEDPVPLSQQTHQQLCQCADSA